MMFTNGNKMTIHNNVSEPWKVTLVDTGLDTMTAIQPDGRFGVLDIDDKTNSINQFLEKSREDGGWINGGFMVVEPKVFDYIEDDNTIFE